MEAPAEVKDVEMYESAAPDASPDNRAPSSPQKRERSSSSPESPQSDYPPGQRMRTSGGVKVELECNQCGHTFRKHSDLKKHNARHSRQHRCVEDNCPRAQIGFATINDLYRHEKSVHGKHVGKSRSYKCFAPGCAKASKLWPRLDNFKQHLIRMHPNEELDALVKKSEQWHADEEEGETGQGLVSAQDSAISALQNVRGLHSSPGPGSQGPLLSPTENGVGLGRQWDLTPPTNALGHAARPKASFRNKANYHRKVNYRRKVNYHNKANYRNRHCIFRRTVIREGPTNIFSWAELVGIQNLARKVT
ncbi:hypothetical protein DV738_g2596, partial [Chaetothyriales sp. CBS 135597]